MKQLFKLSLFIFFLIGCHLTTVDAADFQENSTIERQTVLHNAVHLSIDKEQKIDKQQTKRKRKVRKKFKELFKNVDTKTIKILSIATLVIGISSVVFALLALILEASILALLVVGLIIGASITGALSLGFIKDSGEKHLQEKIFSIVGLVLAYLPAVILVVALILFIGWLSDFLF